MSSSGGGTGDRWSPTIPPALSRRPATTGFSSARRVEETVRLAVGVATTVTPLGPARALGYGRYCAARPRQRDRFRVDRVGFRWEFSGATSTTRLPAPNGNRRRVGSGVRVDCHTVFRIRSVGMFDRESGGECGVESLALVTTKSRDSSRKTGPNVKMRRYCHHHHCRDCGDCLRGCG